MTNKELIEQLQKYPENLDVYVTESEQVYVPFQDIKVECAASVETKERRLLITFNAKDKTSG
jgi:predicted transport protein